MRRQAALGDGWHVGVVTVLAEETRAVLEVFGFAGGRRFHTGRMAVPGGVTYLVIAPPAGVGGVTAALAGLCARYDPPVVVGVSGGATSGGVAGPAGGAVGFADGAADGAGSVAGSAGGGAGPAGERGLEATSDVLLAGGREPVAGAMAAFFAAAGEPATLPGFRGAAPVLVRRDADGGDVARFCAGATTQHGKPLAWAVIRGGAIHAAAQTLRYLIPYLRPRL